LPAITVSDPKTSPADDAATALAPSDDTTEPAVSPNVVPIIAVTKLKDLAAGDIEPVPTTVAQAMDTKTPAASSKSIRSPLLVKDGFTRMDSNSAA
jgi:hypothetical protein